MARIRVTNRDTKTTRTIALSQILNKGVLVVIGGISGSIGMVELVNKLPMTRSSVDKVLRILREFDLISFEFDGKFKKIIPSEKLIELRKKIIALVREVENIERL